MTFAIAARELRSLFLSPLAWILLAVVQVILAWVFLLLIDELFERQQELGSTPVGPIGVTDLVAAPLLHIGAWVLLLVVPLLTMRLVAEERRSHTLPLLLSSPVTVTQIVLGKYIGVVSFLLVMVGMIVLMPLSLYAGTNLDAGKLAAGTLGLFLVGASFASAGLFMSTLTTQPAIAAVSTFGLLLILWLIDASVEAGSASLLKDLSILRHYEGLLRGLFDSADIGYYLVFISAFLGLSVCRIDSERRAI